MAERNAEQPHVVNSSAQWLSDYASDVWNKPEEHLAEIGTATALTAAALFPLARAGLKAVGERGAAGETVMSSTALKNAVAGVRDLSYEVDSGFSTLVGKIGPRGERILSTADHNAFRLSPLKGPSSDAVYAHELVLPKGGNSFTARFIVDSKHSNSWSTLSNPVWPEGKTGIWSNLKDAGISVRQSERTPIKLEFANDMSRLEIAPLSGQRFDIALDAALEGKVKAVGQSAVSNRVSSISIEGPLSVRNGNGLMSVHNPEWKIEGSQVYRYPEVKPGETLRVYYDPLATVGPKLTPDVRYMTKTEGLVRPV